MELVYKLNYELTNTYSLSALPKQELDKKIFNKIPDYLAISIRLFTENEFEEIPNRNGSLVKASDNLTAYLEACIAIKNGIQNEQCFEAKNQIENRYKNEDKNVYRIDFSKIFVDFE